MRQPYQSPKSSCSRQGSTDPLDGHDQEENQSPTGQRELRAQPDNVEFAGDDLKNYQGDNEACNSSETTVRIDAAEIRGQDRDQ